MDKNLIISILREKNLISGLEPEFKRLKGGVSSDIFLVRSGDDQCVVKQALEKLNVEDDWFADISRNENEQEFIKYLSEIKPKCVPKLLYSNEKHSFFAMEYLGSDFKNWKEEMLNGIFSESTARRSAELLGDIHVNSLENGLLKKRFDKAENFYELRIEPYLVTTGNRHPELRKYFHDEAKRLRKHRQAIVHGDFSPKNLMINSDQVVLLDHEVAWFGDPAFDLAFFLNHLYLKMLFHYTKTGDIKDLTATIWKSYFDKLGYERKRQMENRVIRLLLMMMLARVDGKSPVEYLDEGQKEFVREFVKKHLTHGTVAHQEINKSWKKKLEDSYH